MGKNVLHFWAMAVSYLVHQAKNLPALCHLLELPNNLGSTGLRRNEPIKVSTLEARA